ncbi:phosphoribosylamine--glycine ligase [Amorphus sp. 3PC139-8]|uniref:phosphoribosylamine--glycine ligase n=1 Tax=Amorphus sp. 3PC139-8 TaxID=2735676 RepID=UPI00345CF3A1
MNILLIGGGGREHALAWALKKSPRVERLFAAPGNPGIATLAETIPLKSDDHDAVVAFCRETGIDLVVVGPEAPLVAGLVDVLDAAGIRAFGPTKAASALEGSKGFTKELCAEANIPTAAFRRAASLEAALAALHDMGAPIVVKADGLAAGKGVVVAETMDEAQAAIEACFSGSFGAAGAEVVLEEKLIGEEASFFALTDGETVLPLATAQDHKRAFDGDQGPNTGGMGAYSPAPVMSDEMVARTLREIVEPTVARLKARGTPFRGVLYAGLMITDEGPKLIEYNVRFGDPECQVLMVRLESDLAELLFAASAPGGLSGMTATWSAHPALTVVMATKGYPGPVETGSEIKGLDAIDDPQVVVFHAGTARADGRLVAKGGRVLAVTASGTTIEAARGRAYAAVDKIDWPEGFYRTDIGARAIGRSS